MPDITPDAVRALIAEAEKRYDHYDLPNRLSMSNWSDREVIEALAEALSALLPREDADLDAIEERLAYLIAGSGSGLNLLGALLARVRTAEAEAARQSERADEVHRLIWKQRELLTGVADALNGPPPPLTTWSHHDLPERAAALASRTVETAEEWEYKIDGFAFPLPREHQEGATHRRRPAAEPGPWEPVPPTPEERTSPYASTSTPWWAEATPTPEEKAL